MKFGRIRESAIFKKIGSFSQTPSNSSHFHHDSIIFTNTKFDYSLQHSVIFVATFKIRLFLVKCHHSSKYIQYRSFSFKLRFSSANTLKLQPFSVKFARFRKQFQRSTISAEIRSCSLLQQKRPFRHRKSLTQIYSTK